jgi:hypothetical protein
MSTTRGEKKVFVKNMSRLVEKILFFLIGRNRDECKEEIYLNELFKREISEYRVTILGFLNVYFF